MNNGVASKVLPISPDRQTRPGQLRTVGQVAVELSVAPSTVRAWIAQRRLGHVRLGRAIRVPSTEIARVMEEGFTPPMKR